MIKFLRLPLPLFFLPVALAAALGIASLIFDVQGFLKDWDQVSAHDFATAKWKNDKPKWDIDKLSEEVRNLRHQTGNLQQDAKRLRKREAGDWAAFKANRDQAREQGAQSGPDLRFQSFQKVTVPDSLHRPQSSKVRVITEGERVLLLLGGPKPYYQEDLTPYLRMLGPMDFHPVIIPGGKKELLVLAAIPASSRLEPGTGYALFNLTLDGQTGRVLRRDGEF